MNTLGSTTYTVYMHKFPNNKVYIGITSLKPSRRWKKGQGYKHRQPLIYRAINKYGWDNVEHIILFKGLKKEEAEQKEIELISLYNSTNKSYGYNVESGGNVNKHLSEETKEKLRQANIGKRHSEESKKKISEANKNKHHLTKEHLKKLRAGRKYKFDPWNKGINVDRGKHILQYAKDGTFIKEWVNGNAAQNELGIQHVYEVCEGKRKTAGGYIWKYA